VSGGFDLVHIGHDGMLNESKLLEDYLKVIKPEIERKEILEGFAVVDEVIITNHHPNHYDRPACRELKTIKSYVFANGGNQILTTIPNINCAKT
jgi:glycerol-3-phosphate cytidylyltransferase-like family protein